MERYAVIVAGGKGTRMGSEIPKQFLTLCGRPVLWWSMKAFHDNDPSIRLILVLPEEHITLWDSLFHALPAEEQFPHEITSGGATRGESVKNGLALVKNDDSQVAIHDGARPLVSQQCINFGWEAADEHGTGAPVIPVVDSMRIMGKHSISYPVKRDYFMLVQTPQVFNTSLIKEAYKKAADKQFTDDATVAENAGHFISLFAGDPDNIKITNPKDLAIATILMSKDG